MKQQGCEQPLVHHAPKVLRFCHRFLLLHLVALFQRLRLDNLDQLLTQRRDQQLDRFDQGGHSRLRGYLFQLVNENRPYLRHSEGEAGCALLLGAHHHNVWCGLLNQERVIAGYQISDLSVAMCYELISAVTGLLLVLNL